MAHDEGLGMDLRAELELLLRRIAVAGHIPDSGIRELRIRLNGDHRIAWFEATSVRVAASVLESSSAV